MKPQTSSTADNTTLSPTRGCDLSPGFHLSAPWSPSARRGLPRNHPRASPLGNRPRTFSEYSAGPPSAGSSAPQLLQERSASASAGLSAAEAGAEWRRGGREEEEGDPRLGTRARSFTCGSRDRDPFGGWSIDGREEEPVAGGGGGGVAVASCVSPAGGGGGKVGGENGGIGRPASPFHRRRHRSRPYFGR